MFNRHVNAVLTILTLSVVADKRILSEEITAFVESAERLNAEMDSDLEITEAKLLLWFEFNRADIQSKMDLKPLEFEAWLKSVFDEVAALPKIDFIADIVDDIAKSDGEFHISEEALEMILARRFEVNSRAA